MPSKCLLHLLKSLTRIELRGKPTVLTDTHRSLHWTQEASKPGTKQSARLARWPTRYHVADKNQQKQKRLAMCMDFVSRVMMQSQADPRLLDYLLAQRQQRTDGISIFDLVHLAFATRRRFSLLRIHAQVHPLKLCDTERTTSRTLVVDFRLESTSESCGSDHEV